MMTKYLFVGAIALSLGACSQAMQDMKQDITNEVKNEIQQVVGQVEMPAIPAIPGLPVLVAKNAGIVTVPSQHSVDVTIDRMAEMVKAKGLTVFARIDHYQNAKDMDLVMRPNTLLIFGSPKIGAPIMNESPTIGMDVPVKALAWQDEAGNVFLSYNDPAYLKARHGIKTATAPLDNMAQALAGLTAKAAGE